MMPRPLRIETTRRAGAQYECSRSPVVGARRRPVMQGDEMYLELLGKL